MRTRPTSKHRARRHAVAFTIAVTLLLAAGGPARAESPYALVLDGAGGLATSDELALDLVLGLRTSFLELGVVAGGGGRVFGERSNAHRGVVAGLRYPVSEVLRLELLGEAGVDEVGATEGLFGAPRHAASTTLPYLGLRAGVDLRFGGRVAFVLGAWGTLRQDLRRERLSSDGVDLGEAGGTWLAVQGRLGLELGFGG